MRLLKHRVRDGYAIQSHVAAESRGFHYTLHRRAGDWHYPATGSMTTAGLACLTLGAEGLLRTRKFKAADRKKLATCIRDGLAWLQENFAVDANPGQENGRHQHYYLYGLERMGMLLGKRWIGTHDWYKEGADWFLAKQDRHGAWGRTPQTSFGLLFLKRATRATDRVVTTD